MAARVFVPRLSVRAASHFVAPTRAFSRSVIPREVVSPSAVSANGPGTADMSPATQINVTSFVDGQRATEQIQVSKPVVVTPAGADIQHAASALKPELTAQLTPTMKKFTLHGKVAVVTG